MVFGKSVKKRQKKNIPSDCIPQSKHRKSLGTDSFIK